ncbi:MAG: chemotaxis protein CheX [Thermodesulfobacteriota bacterium]
MAPECASWQEGMIQAVTATIENLAFTEVLPQAPGEAPPPAADWPWTRLPVREPAAGELCLAMSPDLLAGLAATVYGPVMGEIGPAQENDLLAEILNTIAGRFLADILPPGEVFRLGLPEAGSGPPALPGPPACTCHFVAEDEPFAVTVAGAALLALRQTG